MSTEDGTYAPKSPDLSSFFSGSPDPSRTTSTTSHPAGAYNRSAQPRSDPQTSPSGVHSPRSANPLYPQARQQAPTAYGQPQLPHHTTTTTTYDGRLSHSSSSSLTETYNHNNHPHDNTTLAAYNSQIRPLNYGASQPHHYFPSQPQLPAQHPHQQQQEQQQEQQQQQQHSQNPYASGPPANPQFGYGIPQHSSGAPPPYYSAPPAAFTDSPTNRAAYQPPLQQQQQQQYQQHHSPHLQSAQVPLAYQHQPSNNSTSPGVPAAMPPRKPALAPELVDAQQQQVQQAAQSEIMHSPVRTKFPTARIKRIMQADEEVGKVAQQTPIAVGKALELFMVQIVTKSADVARDRNSKRISAQMLRQAVETNAQWDFLQDIVSKVSEKEDRDGGTGRGRPKTEAGTESDEEADAEPKKKARGRKKKSVG